MHRPIPDKIPLKGPGLVIGLTGSIGAGKSTVGEILKGLGATLLDADRLAKEVLEKPQTIEKLRSTFGPEILDPSGKVDREALAGVVFSDAAKRDLLTGMIHPGVRMAFHEAVEQMEKGDVLVYDIPLLFETGSEDLFDWIVTVSADESIRIQRVQERNGWSPDEYRRRIASQIPQKNKEEMAHTVILNNEDRARLESKVKKIYRQLLRASDLLDETK